MHDTSYFVIIIILNSQFTSTSLPFSSNSLILFLVASIFKAMSNEILVRSLQTPNKQLFVHMCNFKSGKHSNS